MKALCNIVLLQLNQISIWTFTRPLHNPYLVSFRGKIARVVQFAALLHKPFECWVLCDLLDEITMIPWINFGSWTLLRRFTTISGCLNI